MVTPFAVTAVPETRIAMGIEYDGSAHCGWQSQPSGHAVQDALARALKDISGHAVSVVAAGRTDAGVHALAQVAHFDTTALRPLTAWVRGTNAGLPSTIRVRWAQEVPREFHARFSAHARSYTYVLQDSTVAPALLAGKLGWHHQGLSIDAMRAAAAVLIGEHDFSAFRAAECQAKSPVKHVYDADVRRVGEMIVLRISANAFLHHMVRNIVGALVYVGAGKQPTSWLGELLRARDRARGAPTFMPDGLYLTQVHYPSSFRLPADRREPLALQLPPVDAPPWAQ
jgi:tRNA pseudouridine38-40 synthase